MTKIARSFRIKVLKVLDALISGGTTKSFGRGTPYRDSLAKLKSVWFDELSRRKESAAGAFYEDELSALAPITKALQALDPAVMGDNVAKMQKHPLWRSLVARAKDANARLLIYVLFRPRRPLKNCRIIWSRNSKGRKWLVTYFPVTRNKQGRRIVGPYWPPLNGS
jgi:hypothetical protein